MKLRLSPAVLLALALLPTLTVLNAPVTAAGDPGTLVVRSTPPGAEIALDGEPRGRTPRTLRGIAPGTHELVLRKQGYNAAFRVATVRSGGRSTLVFTLVRTRPVSEAKKQTREALLMQTAGRLETLERLQAILLPFSIAMSFGGSGGPPVEQPDLGLYYTVRIDTNRLAIMADFFTDAEGTQPGGRMALTVNPVSAEITVGYEFTAGKFAGTTGRMSVNIASETAFDLNGKVSLSDGAVAVPAVQSAAPDEEDAATRTDTGRIVLTEANGADAGYELSGSATEQVIYGTTSSGFKIALHSDLDHGRRCLLSRAGSGEILAAAAWREDGIATLQFPDGTATTVQLFTP